MNSFLRKNKTVLLLYSLHLAIFISIAIYQGFNYSGEGQKFVSEAQQLIGEQSGEVFQFQLLNLSYIIYLSIFIKLGVTKALIILFTHFISLFTYFKFHTLLTSKFNKVLANWWLGFMLFSPIILTWNLSLYSESFYIAIYLLFAYELFAHTLPAKRIFIYALILVFSKPTGILLLAALAAYKLHCTGKWSLQKATVYFFAFCIFLFSLVFFFVKLHFNGVAQVILNCSVICGFPTNSNVYAPAQFSLFNTYQLLIEKHGIMEVLNLMGLKFISFFTLTRPYYSFTHNLVNGAHVVFFVLNFLALWKAFKQKLNFHFNVLLFIQIIIVVHAFVVMWFFNEWTERYTTVIFPFLFLSSAYAINQIKPVLKRAV